MRLLLTINCKFALDFFARGLHTSTAVARLPLRQLGFLVLLIYFYLLHFNLANRGLVLGDMFMLLVCRVALFLM